MKKYYDADVIVIGSGHNGLVTAAYLSKWGYKVLVFERRDTIRNGTSWETIRDKEARCRNSRHIVLQ